ncbi:MAG TPA: carbon monoxide dehydrogenase subunit G [Bryobacteraceae bacterium]|nr:carbon monoxide dehydrogenase subunit G [Bryobacteraceae bacterium]
MKIAGSAQLPFAPQRSYELMQDPEVLARAIPGCESLEKTGDGEYRMKMKMVLASVSGAFEGRVQLVDPVPPTSFRMVVEGSGKIGFMKGDGVLTLALKDCGTEVSYDGDAQVGGTMAAVGQRLIDTTARMLIKRFFEKLAAEPAS